MCDPRTSEGRKQVSRGESRGGEVKWSYYRLGGPQETGLGKKSLMDDFWLPKVSGALGTGKKGGKNPSQFQHVVGYRHLLFPFHETLAFQIEGVKPSEQRRKNLPQV